MTFLSDSSFPASSSTVTEGETSTAGNRGSCSGATHSTRNLLKNWESAGQRDAWRSLSTFSRKRSDLIFSAGVKTLLALQLKRLKSIKCPSLVKLALKNKVDKKTELKTFKNGVKEQGLFKNPLCAL